MMSDEKNSAARTVIGVTSMKNMLPVVKSMTIEVPAGRYVIGDPCYAISGSKRWSGFGNSCDWFDGSAIARLGDQWIVGFGTAYGDGLYRGSDGNNYPVDSGLLGLVPVEFADTTQDLPIIEMSSSGLCFYDNGVIHLGPVKIDTDPDDEWEDEWDEEEDGERDSDNDSDYIWLDSRED